MEYYDLGDKITAYTTDRTVGRSREKMAKVLSFSNFMYPHQTHTDRVKEVTEEFFLLPEAEQKELMEGVDAVISDVKDACIGISTADCIPVIVYDKEHHCAAAIHAGWKGTVKRIAEKAVKLMQETYGTRPSQCTAAIGPGISQDSFEVGWEVHEIFKEAGFEMDDVTIVMPSRDGKGTRPHLDLKEINRRQLLQMGIPPENIFVSPIDTFTDERFFSARREQKGTEKCGRILSGFILN